MYNQETITNGKKKIIILTNETKSKDVLIFVHGLNGSASFGKPLFKSLNCKVVLMEQRGNNNPNLKPSRSIGKHLDDIEVLINHYNKLNYNVYLMGESVGASYITILSYRRDINVKAIFAQSIPNKVVDIMIASKWKRFVINFMTVFSLFTNINYKYYASVQYDKLSSNKALHRVARMSDKKQAANVRETLSSWAANKRVWKYLKSNKEPSAPLYLFEGTNDELLNIDKLKKKFKITDNKEYILIKDAKHILMYEKPFTEVIKKIKSVMNIKTKK